MTPTTAPRWALVNPPPRARIERDDRPDYPHIGLGGLAACLRKRLPGLELAVIDAKLEALDLERTVKRVVETRPKVLGLTAMTHELDRAAAVAAAVKQALPETMTVLGGVHATALAVETLKQTPQFDAAVAGEAEEVVHLLGPELMAQDGPVTVPGLALRRGTEIIEGPAPRPVEDLDNLPFPDWSRFPPAREYPILSARGCPFKCIFCARPYGDRVRRRSPGNVVAEMEAVVELHRPRMINFYDETFGVDRARMMSLMELIRARGLHKRVGWYATTRVDVMNEEALDAMAASGCVMVGFGVESGNPEILSASGKGIDLGQAERMVGHARRLGLFVQTYFILGHPNETRETAMDTIRFAARLNASLTAMGIMVPYPGSEVYEMARRGRGGYRLITDDWSAFNKQLGNALELESLSRRQLENLQLKGYIWVYLRNLRIFDFLRFAWRYRREALAFLRKRLGSKRTADPEKVKPVD